MRWTVLIAAVIISLILSLLLSRITHSYVFILVLPLLFAPFVFGWGQPRS
jgi:hypothetical protein